MHQSLFHSQVVPQNEPRTQRSRASVDATKAVKDRGKVLAQNLILHRLSPQSLQTRFPHSQTSGGVLLHAGHIARHTLDCWVFYSKLTFCTPRIRKYSLRLMGMPRTGNSCPQSVTTCVTFKCSDISTSSKEIAALMLPSTVTVPLLQMQEASTGQSLISPML